VIGDKSPAGWVGKMLSWGHSAGDFSCRKSRDLPISEGMPAFPPIKVVLKVYFQTFSIYIG
jgi:hypothetical protein